MTSEVRPRASFRNILVPTDFSPCSDAILPYVASLARKSNAKLFLAHVVTPEVLSIEPPVVLEVRGASEKQMQDILASEQLEGITTAALIGEGAPSDAVGQMVREHDIDLIVLSTHGRTGFRKFIMGSVAEEIFRHAPCPVMTLGPKVEADTRHHAAFRHVVYATDLAADTTAGMSFVRGFMDPTKDFLTLMHVVPHTPVVDAEVATNELRRKLLDLIPANFGLVDPPEVVIEIGNPAEWIIQDAAARHADLIVLGCHRTGAMTTHFMDTAYKVIIEAPCPVLTISAAYKAAAA